MSAPRHTEGFLALVHTQLLTIPCYAVGALAYLCAASISDRLGKRGYFAAGGCLVACVGYAVLLGTYNQGPGVQYAGTIIVALGLYVAVGIPIAWMPNNLPSHYKRAAGQGCSMTLGNSAGVWAVNVAIKPRARCSHPGAFCLAFHLPHSRCSTLHSRACHHFRFRLLVGCNVSCHFSFTQARKREARTRRTRLYGRREDEGGNRQARRLQPVVSLYLLRAHSQINGSSVDGVNEVTGLQAGAGPEACYKNLITVAGYYYY
jgi:nitrate/nitrite transporter NarK